MQNPENLINNLSASEKIRLFNGDGSWKTCSFNDKLPYFFMSDGPHGLRKQEAEEYADLNKSKPATCFPTASCAASSWSRETLSKLGAALSKEANGENVNMVLGPGINIKRSPLCGRNSEYFSEDPYLSGTLAASYIKEMQKNGVGACVKHFACNNQEKRRQTSNSIVDERTLREIYLRAFEIVIKESSPSAVMGSYNRLNGEYTCASKKLLTEILRNQWGYKGIVISDWGACIDAGKCISAGLNLAMPDSMGYLSGTLEKSLADKVISESQIENAVKPVLETALWFKEHKPSDPVTVDYNQQHTIAKEIAEDSAVLLKNENFLPLKKGKIAVIGELAEFMKFQGGGSSHITTREYPNALQAFKNLGYDVLYSKGYYSGFCKKSEIEKINKPLFEEALNFTREAAVENIPILFFTGLAESYEGEGFDRKDIYLPDEQADLLKQVLDITDNVAVINFSGAPVSFVPARKAKAILQMYLCGEGCGEAVADLISGKFSPSGKLAETFPLDSDQAGIKENFALEEDNIEYRENVFVGYRHYESKNLPVLYEFGFGLSYTNFEYKDLKIISENPEKTIVSLSVINTENYDGNEIIQIYVKPEQSEEEKKLRPVRELRGFEKVFLKAGETKTVEITLDENAFKIFSEKKNDFITAGGNYIIEAAASVKDIRLTEKIKIKGECFLEHVSPVPESFYTENRISSNHKGSFTLSDSLGDMAKESRFIRKALKLLVFLLVLTSRKSEEDPSVKITISAIKENPLESLISTSGGVISEKISRWLLKKANR